MNDLVSIIIPCYNYGRFLSETMESVLNQTYTHWECIIIDDGSSDNTAEISRKYTLLDKRIKYIYQENQGVSAARNKGIQQSIGDYIQFLDADDLLSTNKIEEQLNYLIKNQKYSFILSEYAYFDTQNPNIKLPLRGLFKDKDVGLKETCNSKSLLHKLVINNFLQPSCLLMKKDILISAGLFDKALPIYQDWDLWIKCAVKGSSLLYIPNLKSECLIRFGHTSLMGNKKQMLIDGLLIRKRLYKYLNWKWKIYNAYRHGKLLIKLLLFKIGIL